MPRKRENIIVNDGGIDFRFSRVSGELVAVGLEDFHTATRRQTGDHEIVRVDGDSGPNFRVNRQHGNSVIVSRLSRNR